MRAFLKKHYHWIIAVVVLLQCGFHGGASNTYTGVHLIPVTEALGLTRTEFSLGGSAKSVVGVLATMCSGFLLTRYGYRITASICMCFAACVYLLLSGMNSYPVYLLCSAMMGITAGVCNTAGATRIVSNWFHRRFGTVLGMVTAATGLCGSLLNIGQSAAVENISWRASYLLVAVIFGIIALLVWFVVRDHPSQLKLAPYGEGQREPGKTPRRRTDWEGPTMRQMIRRPAFYLMSIATFLSGVSVYLAFSFTIPHLRDCGLTAAQASTINSMLLLCLTGTKFLAGLLSDLMGARKVTLLCSFTTIFGLILLRLVDSFGLAVVAVLIYALAVPITTVTIPLLAAALFGYRAQPQYTGIFLAMVTASSVVSGPISNAVYDLTGSYSPAFLGGAVLAAVTSVLYLVLYRLADRDRAAMELKAEN